LELINELKPYLLEPSFQELMYTECV